MNIEYLESSNDKYSGQKIYKQYTSYLDDTKSVHLLFSNQECLDLLSCLSSVFLCSSSTWRTSKTYKPIIEACNERRIRIFFKKSYKRANIGKITEKAPGL